MRQALPVSMHELRLHQRIGKRDAGPTKDGSVFTALARPLECLTVQDNELDYCPLPEPFSAKICITLQAKR